MTGYRLPRGTRGFAPRVSSAAELKRLLGASDGRSWHGKRDTAVLVCLGVGGLRAGEVAGLRAGDVELLSYRAVLRVTGKGGKRRVVVIGGHGASAQRAWAKARGVGVADEPFFVARRSVENGPPRPLNVASIDYIVRKAARVSGLPGVHAHSLRHTAASLALSGGSNLIEVREMLGHSSIVTTSRYLHVTNTETAASGALRQIGVD